MKSILITLFVFSSVAMASQNGVATTVYQWTDADGVVHFSDAAPTQDSTTETREINFDSFTSTTPDQGSLSIIEQANIMAEWRKQETERRLAMRRMQLEQQRLSQAIDLDRQESLDRRQEYFQDRPHYYVFPRAINYHYRNLWNNRPSYTQFSNSHYRDTRPQARKYSGPDQGVHGTGFATKF